MATIAKRTILSDDETLSVTLEIVSDYYTGEELELILSRSPVIRLDSDGDTIADIVYRRLSLELEVVIKEQYVEAWASALMLDGVTCTVSIPAMSYNATYNYVNESNRWNVGQINKVRLTFVDQINTLKDKQIDPAIIESYNSKDNNACSLSYDVRETLLRRIIYRLGVLAAHVVGDVKKYEANGNAIASYVDTWQARTSQYGGLWGAMVNYRQLIGKSLYDILKELATAFGYFVYLNDLSVMLLAKNIIQLVDKTDYTANKLIIDKNNSPYNYLTTEVIKAKTVTGKIKSKTYELMPVYNVSVVNDYGLKVNLHYGYDFFVNLHNYNIVYGSQNTASLSVKDGKIRVTHSNKTTINPKYTDYYILRANFGGNAGNVKSVKLKIIVDDVDANVSVWSSMYTNAVYNASGDNYIAYPGETEAVIRSYTDTFKSTPNATILSGKNEVTLTWELETGSTSLNLLITPPVANISGTNTKVDYVIDSISVDSYMRNDYNVKGETVNVINTPGSETTKYKEIKTVYGSAPNFDMYEDDTRLAYAAQLNYPIVSVGKYFYFKAGGLFAYEDEANKYKLNELLARMYAKQYSRVKKRMEVELYAQDRLMDISATGYYLHQPLIIDGTCYYPISGEVELLSGMVKLTLEEVIGKLDYVTSEAGDQIVSEVGTIVIAEY